MAPKCFLFLLLYFFVRVVCVLGCIIMVGILCIIAVTKKQKGPDPAECKQSVRGARTHTFFKNVLT